MSVKVQLLDIDNRPTEFDKRAGIIRNGIDNAYAERIERFINNSVTARSASNVLSSYIVGKGFGDEENKTIVGKKGTTLLKFTQKVAKNISKQRGVFIHINYNMNYGYDSFDVIPYTHCRLGEKDDVKYNGKIGVCDNFTNKRLKVDDIDFINVFNPNKDVIDAQVEFAGSWDKYKGQILYVNLDDEYNYALSTIDAVQYDCDSEAQSSIYKNRILRNGFSGKQIIITKPLIGKIEDYNTPEEYREAGDERENFKKVTTGFYGAENAGEGMHVELNHDSDKFDDAIKIIDVPSTVNDKLYESTELSVFKNILMAFHSLPDGMVRSTESMFGNSGESLKEMKIGYQENTSMLRTEVEQVIQMLMRNFKAPKEVKIVPLIDEESIKPEPKTVENEADNKD